MDNTTSNCIVLLAGPSTIRFSKEYLKPSVNHTGRIPVTDYQIALYMVLTKLYDEGCRTFFSTTEAGFGIDAADLVLILRQHTPGYSEIRLIITSAGPEEAAGYDLKDRLRYEDIITNCNVIESFSIENPSEENFRKFRQTQRLQQLPHCEYLVCYDDGQDPDIRELVRQANELGIPVINLYLSNVKTSK